jgi:hypothetical protein
MRCRHFRRLLTFVGRRTPLGRRAEDGMMIVFFTLILTMLLGVAGMAIDLGNWYLHIQRSQRAADAAALAGAAHLPGDPTLARAAATDTLNREGFKGLVVKMEPVDDHPDLMGVRVSEKVQNTFLKMFQVSDFTFNRAAVAGFRPPLKLGSPNNVLGTETATLPRWGSANTLGPPGFSLAVTAGQVKNQGDRWGAKECLTTSSSPKAEFTDRCTGTTNNEHEQTRTFIVDIADGVSGQLVMQGYDIGYYPERSCDADVHLLAAWDHYSASRPSYDPSKRDACAKDGHFNSAGANKRVVVGTQRPDGSNLAECPNVTYNPLPGSDGTEGSTYVDWIPLLASTAPHSPGASYRNWDTFCTLTIGPGGRPTGKYEITVDANDNTNIYNQYSLRAAFVNGGVLDVASTAKVRLYAKDEMTVNIHNQQEKLRMPVVQMDRSTMGRTVKLEIFDLGDLPNYHDLTPYLRLVPAGGWNISSFKCRYYSGLDPAEWIQPCELTNIPGGHYSGRIMTFEIQTPSTATCSFTSAAGCWVMAETDYGAYYSLVQSDTVSFKLVDNGNPMRLYNASQFGF